MYGDGALTLLLVKVEQALTDRVNLKAGVRFELQQLEDEFRILKSFLEDSADKSETTTAVIEETVKQIRETVYDVEDTIDAYLTNKAVAKTKNPLSQLYEKLKTQTEKEVKFIRENVVQPTVEKIYKIRGDLERVPHNEMKKDRPTRASYATVTMEQQSKKQDKVVDFQDEATVREYLMKTTEKLDVIAITGMAGLGKTTFARKIFEHENVIGQFHWRIWVRVSEEFNPVYVFRDILEQIVPKKTRIRTSNYDDLIDTVRGRLEKESFLLVTDDIWTKQDWDEICKILPEDNGKGKVLVTTRVTEVAAVANISRVPHDLKPLGENESLELLKLKVFGLKDFPQELVDIGKVIVEKCRGVPLTILVVGGVLKGCSTLQKPMPTQIAEWSKVSENILKTDEQNTISKLIEMSYKRLISDELRLCFLYTGLFPENQEISTSTLTQLWIAEGFVQKVEGESLEQTAEKILDTLINENLLMMIIRKSPDQVKTCRLHDMMRGFCRDKAMKENLFREIKKSQGVFDPSLSEVPKFRRLCFNSNPTEFLSKCWKKRQPRVRSFLCLSKESVYLDEKHISTMSEAFKKLRVLDCKFINFRQFPKVKRLRLLKYVTLSIGKLNVVPEEISQLVNLETLIVLTTSDSITVKANIWEMDQLRRLKTKAPILLDDKCWKGNESCETLQTISRLSHESCKESIPVRAPNLKVLAIQGKVADLFNTLRMEKMGQLEKLKVVNDQSTASAHPLLLNPQHCFPPKLKSLTLSNTYLKWNEHMPILTKINTLKVLKLKDDAFTGIGWNASGDGFPRLQFLLMENTKLVNWMASTHYFPSLTWLVVKNCKELLGIPESLGRYLEKLEIERVDKSVAVSAKKIESDKQTQQIPNPRWKVPFKLTIGLGCGY